MSGWLSALQLAALTGAAATLASLLAGGLLYRLLRTPLRRLAPAPRARWLSSIAAAPLVLPALLLGLCLLPSLLAGLGLQRDHCPSHGGHLHLCLLHLPRALPPAWALASLLGAVPLVGAAGAVAAAALRARRLQSSLELASTGRLRPDVRLVEAALPLSVTVGLLRPRIFLSLGFVSGLDGAGLESVIEHERAHARRRDGLRRLIAAALSWMYPAALRRPLLADLALACEQACDASAAERVGDRLSVAEAILAAERLLGRSRVPGGVCAFGGSSVPERVEQLLSESGRLASARPYAALRWVAASLLGGGLALGLADPVHHGVEHLLALLLH